jgi:hypothetical protein
MDIGSGESEHIDVAAYIPGNGEHCVHFWNNESYTYPGWLNTRRRVRPGRYFIAVRVVCAGATSCNVFELDADDLENMNWHPVRRSTARKVWAEFDYGNRNSSSSGAGWVAARV